MVCRALAIGVLEALVMGNMKPVGLPGEALVRIEEGHMRCAAIQSTATPVPVQAPQPYRLRAWIGHYSPCVAAVLLGALPVGWVAQTSPAVRDAHAFLQRYVSVTAQDIAALDRGGVVVQTLKTNAPTGVAILGVIRIAASSESFLERFRDITDFKKGPEIPQVGRFADPPRLEDVEPLVVDAADLEALRSCRVGNCDIKLTGQMVGRFHQIDWAAPNWRDLTASLFKRLLVERVVAYSRSGNTALGAYRDKGRAVEIADEIHAVVDASARLCGHAPEFLKHVECPSSQVLAASEHFVYWSKEKLAFKPVTSLTDVTIYRKAYEATAATFIASKDLYSSHYFLTSLGLTLLVDTGSNEAPAFYLVYANRSRVDALGGTFSALRRWLVERRARAGAEKYSFAIRLRMQRDRNAQRALQTCGLFWPPWVANVLRPQ